MFLTIFLILKSPYEARDEEPKESAVFVYKLSIAVHSIGFFLKLATKVEKIRMSKIVQTLEAFFTILHVYFFLICIETFAKFQIKSAKEGFLLTPEAFYLEDNLSKLSFCKYKDCCCLR